MQNISDYNKNNIVAETHVLKYNENTFQQICNASICKNAFNNKDNPQRTNISMHNNSDC